MARKEKKDKTANQQASGVLGKRIYTAAFLCERAIREHPVDIISAMRLVDLHTIDLPPLQPDTAIFLPNLETDLIVLFKSESPQSFTASVVTNTPSGQLEPTHFPCTTTGGVAGAALSIRVKLDFKIQGDYWFDVLVDGELATRVPLRVMHNPVGLG